MQKQLVLVALLSLVVGVAVADKSAKPRVAPMSASEEALKECELHDAALQIGTARILYGDRPPFVNDPAAQRDFPHARSHVLGGCIVGPDSPDLQAVKFCTPCREAEKQWLIAHNRSIPAN